MLSYLLWWITGIIFLFAGKDPDVKYHAAQSTVFFGSTTVLNIVLGVLAGLPSLGVLHAISSIIWLFAVVVWIIALIRANNQDGARFQLPLVGAPVAEYAEKLAATVD
jgi:uncharacterized membrane protein